MDIIMHVHRDLFFHLKIGPIRLKIICASCEELLKQTERTHKNNCI